MRFSNELKVGLAIIVAGIIFILGVRYFSNIPLFGGTYTYETEFNDVGGLMKGNTVLVNGLIVGNVTEVFLNSESQRVGVRFVVDKNVVLPEGSYANIGGFSALGRVDLEVVLGQPGNPPLSPGTSIPGRDKEDLLSLFEKRAPVTARLVDSLLISAGLTFNEAQHLLGKNDSELYQALTGVKNATTTVDQMLRMERERISQILSNFENVSEDLGRFTDQNSDSLALTVQNLNHMLARLDSELDTVNGSVETLNLILNRVERGEGTLGQLVNDQTLYHRLDSITTNLNRILIDFETNPGRYLREIKLVDLF